MPLAGLKTQAALLRACGIALVDFGVVVATGDREPAAAGDGELASAGDGELATAGVGEPAAVGLVTIAVGLETRPQAATADSRTRTIKCLVNRMSWEG